MAVVTEARLLGWSLKTYLPNQEEFYGAVPFCIRVGLSPGRDIEGVRVPRK